MLAGLIAGFVPFIAPVFPNDVVKSAAAEVAELERVLASGGHQTDGRSSTRFHTQANITSNGPRKTCRSHSLPRG